MGSWQPRFPAPTPWHGGCEQLPWLWARPKEHPKGALWEGARGSRTKACLVSLRCLYSTVHSYTVTLMASRETCVTLFSVPELCSVLSPSAVWLWLCKPLFSPLGRGAHGRDCPPQLPRRCRAHLCWPPTCPPQPRSNSDLPAGRAAWSCCTSSLAEKINNLFNKAFYPLYILSLIKILHRQKVQKLV